MTPPGGALSIVPIAGGLPLAGGDHLSSCRLGIRRIGSRGRPVVLVLGGISAGRDVATGGIPGGWWEQHAGGGRPLDTDRFELLGVDWLGGRGSSSAPGRGERFPAITTHDQAAAIVAVCERVGIGRLHAVVGASFGGMVALALAAGFAERLGRVVVISAPARSQPMTLGLRDLQRRIVRLGLATGRENEALGIARGLAITTYRTAREFRARFPHALGNPERGVEAYLEGHGRRFAESWTAEQFLCLSEAMDRHAVEPAAIRVPALFAGVRSDALVPAWQLRALHREWGGPSRLMLADSRFGHDAFLKEDQFIAGVLRAGLTDQEHLCTSTPSPREPASPGTGPTGPSSPRFTSRPTSPSRPLARRARTTTPGRPTRPATC